MTLQPTAGNANSSQKGIVNITLKAYSKKEDICTFYQFGRKDAMPRKDEDAKEGSFSIAPGQQSIGTTIQNPDKMYYTATALYDHYNKTYWNTWSANYVPGWDHVWNDYPIVKTVYDPCPAGFHMPPSNAASGFTTTGERSNSVSEINKVGDFDNGVHFRTSPSATTTIYFPALGSRYGRTGIWGGGATSAWHWYATPWDENSGAEYEFGNQIGWGAAPKNALERSNAFIVRPVADFKPSQGATTQPVTPGGVIEW